MGWREPRWLLSIRTRREDQTLPPRCARSWSFAVTGAWRSRRRRLDFLPEIGQGFDNLRVHKLRSVLTMLGMIFGVAAVIAMMSIGAGAQQQVIAFIEQLGVRNVIIEAREAADTKALTNVRKLSTGLTFRDLRMIQASLGGLSASTGRKRFVPSKMLPKPQGDIPTVFGVSSVYRNLAGLTLAKGRFFDESEEASSAVAVLGQAAATALFGSDDVVGQFVKINDQWVPDRRRGRAPAHRARQRQRPACTRRQQCRVCADHVAVLRIEDRMAYL